MIEEEFMNEVVNLRFLLMAGKIIARIMLIITLMVLNYKEEEAL
jgi:hypothetical protein